MSLIPVDLREDSYTLSLAGLPFLSPGLCEIQGASKIRKWDEQAGFGLAGASLVGGGAKLSHFSIKHAIFENPGPLSVQWLGWALFKPVLTPTIAIPNAPSPALGIVHPVLADLGITSVVVEDYSQWTQDAFGLWTMTIKFIEYRAPAPAVAKTVAGPPGGVTPAPTVNAKYGARLNASLSGLAAVAGG